MKKSERTRGVALTGVSRAIFPGSFVVRLSPFDFDRAQNFKLLRRAWIDLAIVYKDDKRAILAVAKGDLGQRAFSEAFAAWGD